MGRRGPPPTPSVILRTRDSRIWSDGRRGPEFTPPPGEPEKPRGLSKQASRIWDAVVPMLARNGILAKIDGPTLERYVTTFALWRIEKRKVERRGTLYMEERDAGQDRKGRRLTEKIPKRSPVVGVFMELSRELGRLEAQFGMSPASRARILAPMVSGGGREEGASGDKRRFLELA
jgi:P27 family predicted phage terminase small subunit